MVNQTIEDRAEVLAETIRRYWKDRGYRVNVTVVNVKGRVRIAEIISDTVNGLPRGYRGSLRDLASVATPPDPPDTSMVRDCITCGKPFTSDGVGNRMCETCRGKASGTDRHEGRER